MFAISVSTGFLIYLLIMGAGLVAAMLYDRWRAANQAWELPEEHLCRCPGCSFTFIVERGGRAALCPRCHRQCAVRRKPR